MYLAKNYYDQISSLRNEYKITVYTDGNGDNYLVFEKTGKVITDSGNLITEDEGVDGLVDYISG